MRQRYLAYGSNMCRDQMRDRCPAAEAAEAVLLEGWRFIINRDGWATLLPCTAARAHGLVWQLTPPCEAALDSYEGVETNDYRRAFLPVGDSDALVYFATEDRPGFPRPGYLERILAGATLLGLPAAYLGELGAWAAAVTPALAAWAVAGFALPPHSIHGPDHWLRVLENGRALAALTPGADPAVVELFALLHDSQRLDDDSDPGHGERAARCVRALPGLGLDARRTALLAEACARHEKGEVSADPTIGCCWDADRLDLSRLHRRPLARLLSTSAARDPMLQAAAWQRGLNRAGTPDLAPHWGL